MAPKRFNVLNALRFLIKRFNKCVTFVIKSALRRFKCLGSLNSAENVGKRVGTFCKFTRALYLLARASLVTNKGLGSIFAWKREHRYTVHSYFLTTFRVPYAVLRDVGEQFWCFLLADLSVGVQTAARAPLCPLFCRKPQVTSGKESLADGWGRARRRPGQPDGTTHIWPKGTLWNDLRLVSTLGLSDWRSSGAASWALLQQQVNLFLSLYLLYLVEQFEFS